MLQEARSFVFFWLLGLAGRRSRLTICLGFWIGIGIGIGCGIEPGANLSVAPARRCPKWAVLGLGPRVLRVLRVLCVLCVPRVLATPNLPILCVVCLEFFEMKSCGMQDQDDHFILLHKLAIMSNNHC
jgi:hypothetical protein